MYPRTLMVAAAVAVLMGCNRGAAMQPGGPGGQGSQAVPPTLVQLAPAHMVPIADASEYVVAPTPGIVGDIPARVGNQVGAGLLAGEQPADHA